jgi:hypothetical protein
MGAKVLGTYECELHEAMADVLASDMSEFVDIGCADGYYAVGVAVRRPDVKVVAFDIDPPARHMTRLLARTNGVSVDVRSEATTDYLDSLSQGAVVFSDCEGCESELLDPVRAPALRRLRIIVEVHDFLDPMISASLRSRFAGTHTMHEIGTEPRDGAAYPELRSLQPAERDALLSERRPAPMTWLVMQPRHTTGV